MVWLERKHGFSSLGFGLTVNASVAAQNRLKIEFSFSVVP